MTKLFGFCCCFIFLISCQSNGERQDPQKARQLYGDGIKILDNRISVQFKDSVKAEQLNKKAIEKFSAAYNADTSFTDALLFASECTMYANDYQNCIYWTSKLKRLDTSQKNQAFCNERIQYCNKQLQSKQ